VLTSISQTFLASCPILQAEQDSVEFNGGTIFVDHSSEFVDVQHQVSFNDG